MEIQYQNEGFHQYMILYPKDVKEEGYEVHMLMQFHGHSLLPVHMYGRNNQLVFQYDITGMTNLQQMTADRELNADYLKRLFTAVWDCCDEIEEYLLSPDALLLSPQMIYYHPGREQFCFGYLPEQTEEFDHCILHLIDFCLKYADHKDEETVMYIYGLYRRVQEGSISREELRDYLGDSTYTPSPVPDRGSVHRKEMKSYNTGSAGVKDNSDAQIVSELYDAQTLGTGYQQEKKPSGLNKQIIPANSLSGILHWIYRIAGGLSVLAIIIFGFRLFRYGQSEWDLKMVVISAVILVVCIYSMIRTGTGTDAGKKGSSKKEFLKEELSQKESIETDSNKVVSNSNINSNSNRDQPDSDHSDPHGSVYRETSVLTDASYGAVLNHQISIQQSTWILKSLISEIPDISLYRLPGVFGRQQDCDYVLPESGISRKHAMIFESGQDLYVEDLGSTNGTYIDNVRLNSGEPVRLQENSILRMGTDQYRIIKASHLFDSGN